MWQPSHPISVRIIAFTRFAGSLIAQFIRDALEYLAPKLTRLLPTRKTIRSILVLWWRRYSGFSASVFLAVLPALTYILIEEYTAFSRIRTERSWWGNFFVDLAEIATVILIVAFFAVYFLRTLYWFQETLPKYWNRYTPPHVHEGMTEKAEDTDRSVVDIFDDSEWSALKWFSYGIGFFGSFILFLLGLEKGLDTTGLLPEFEEHIVQGLSEDGLVSSFAQMLRMLPLVGEVYSFTGELPGETFLGKVLLNGTAVFFAVAVRNWAYMFEHIDHVYRDFNDASLWRSSRYILYLLFNVVASLFTSGIIILVVGTELAFV
ncbi:hypothetical protein [Natrinema sp. DC36]|uniref:hypothetical protein n=1 Tax=Natrinema sp. DC36 TaxID=2878680 RepID=UPI001CF09661|nr:hypothetical protein [Natrinema sp. DC36]